MSKPLDEFVVFAYMNNQYTGYVLSSTDLEPSFHWFYFHDQSFVQEFSETIAFREADGRLRPVHNYGRKSELVWAVQKGVEAYLLRQRHLDA